jgi:flagellar motor switch protein FliG
MAAQQGQMSEAQKIAILIASLDERIAAGVLQQLDPEVMGNVANSIRHLGVVTGEDRQTVLTECFHGINSMGSAVSGDEKLVTSLLTKAIGEKRAVAMLSDDTAPVSSGFEVLHDMSAEQIVTGLGGEQPSIIGTILRYLPPELAGEVLGLLSVDVRNKAVIHICRGNEPDAATLARIEVYIISRFKKETKEDSRSASSSEDPLDIVASLLQNVEKAASDEILQAIETVSESIASQIKDKLFTFEDAIGIDDASIRRILQEVDTGALSVALRNASVDLKQKFFKNMSKRAAEGIKEEMEFAQKMKLSDIQARQREVVEVIRALDADGQISIGGGGGDAYV